VGKGVTFDTGGLSIKPSTNMHYMKSDMGGAAAVLGTMEAAARLQLPLHLYGIVPSTDNSVDARAVKPSEVISSYSGRTIEVIDTDAEGRLILADGLAFTVRNHRPEVVIDLATLTGSAVRTFGYQVGALFSNNDELANALFDAGETSGERVWRLPLHAAYAEEMKSDIADIKNLGSRPVAGAITAAKFLEFFIGDHPRWAHLDIAGVAFGDSPFATGKVATGFGIRLLLTYLLSRGRAGK
jgi:leucyl aminopeptidase